MSTGTELEVECAQLRERIAQLEAELYRRSGLSTPAQVTPEELDAVLEALPLLLYVTDTENKYVACRIGTGMVPFVPPEAIIGRRVQEVLPREVGDAVLSAITRARATGMKQDVRYALPVGSGKSYYSAQIFPLDRGRVATLVMDTTAQRRTEEALRESEAKFRTAFQDAGLGILIVSREGRVIDHNRAFRAMLGYSEEEMRGAVLRELLHPEDARSALADIAEMARGARESVVHERRYRRKDGGWACAMVHATPLRDAAGKYQYSVVVVEDVTQKKALESQLLIADRMASLGTLAAGVAHEINNPLAFVTANVSFVLERLAQLDPDRAEELVQALKEARQGAERVRGIVQDLKTYGRSDDGADEIVDVEQVLLSAIHLAQNHIRHRAKLVLDLQKIAPVAANPHRLEQVFVNLLINATQALGESRPEANEIRVSCRSLGVARILIEVADTGCGIPSEILPRIFDPFFTTKPVGVGTGLGLSICHNIVTGLGGEMQVESEVGRGSTFRVRLPAVRERRDEPGATATCAAATRRSGRVLVIDDEPLVARAVARTLAREHEIVTVTSGAEALERIRNDSGFDAIICDLIMPGMSGMELHASVSTSQPALARRMVFLTGGACTPAARDFLDRVPNQRLEKPFDPEGLRNAVSGVMT